MAKIQFLTILLTATCFLGGVVSVTDKDFQDLVTFVHRQAKMNEEQSRTIKEQATTIAEQAMTIDQQSALIKVMMEKIERQESLIKEVTTRGTEEHSGDVLKREDNLFQNATIEERVTILEAQVVEIEENIADLDQDVNFLFDEQVIQDERLLNLEAETEEIDEQLVIVDDDLESVCPRGGCLPLGPGVSASGSRQTPPRQTTPRQATPKQTPTEVPRETATAVDDLQATTLALDFRVTVLEEDGGGDGNSSVAELEVRVETLEGTAANHETRISVVETDINDLETRLTSAEESIQGLQMTDVELDERVTALEENGGSPQNDTIAFHAVLTSYSSIPVGTAVEFNEVLLNEGDGYDSTTGTFTVPPGGEGFYYFSIYFFVQDGEYSRFDVRINGEVLCSAEGDAQESPTDNGQAACGAATYVSVGDTVRVVYRAGSDTTPLVANTSYYYNGFTGFRI